MTDENIVPPCEQPVRIRWLNAAEQNPTIQKPVAQHPQIPSIKTNKVTAPSVVNKAQTKVPSATNIVRFADQPTPSIDMSIQSSKGIKELNPEDKLKIANLIKELARIGHEKELVENKLTQERKLFEVQMKRLLTDHDRLMKDNQKLLTRYNDTKTMLTEYEKKRCQSSLKPTANEFPNPQRSSTPIDLLSKDSSTTVKKSENDRSAHSLLNEQLQLKQLMMEKQLELLHKQQQILEKQLEHKQITASTEQSHPVIQTITRATSPIKRDLKASAVECATSPIKLPAPPSSSIARMSDKPTHRSIQTQRYAMDHNDEDLLIHSLNESLRDTKIPRSPVNTKSSSAFADPEEQNLLKDIFFIC